MRILSVVVLCFMGLVADSDTCYSKKTRTIDYSDIYTAQEAYDAGFANGVMRDGSEAVKLWDRHLIQNDAPGAGVSNKGNFMEPVFGNRMIRKILDVGDPRCDEAYVVVFFFSDLVNSNQYPLVVSVNGNTTQYRHANTEQYVYVPIEPSWLKKGENRITLSCPEASDAKDAWNIYVARADEYTAGGGDPAVVGAAGGTAAHGLSFLIRGVNEIRENSPAERQIGDYSLLSTDNGKSWSVSGKALHPQPTYMFGNESARDKGGVIGEYTVRLNLRQYTREGTLISPVLDLWAEPGEDAALIPFSGVEKLNLKCQGKTPDETDIVWQIRTGVTMDPLRSNDWTDWITIAAGATANTDITGRVALPPTHWDPERAITFPKVRYIQWRAVLKTKNPLVTASIESVTIDCSVSRWMVMPDNIIVTGFHNPDILYSSTGFEYQSADEPKNQEVIDRDDLDKIIENARSEFDAIVLLLDYASRRWVYAGPRLEYPKWNTIDTLERAHSYGDGGMCIQYAAYLVHILTVMGYQARHVNIISHEVVEVWSDDFDKWVYLDPTQGVDYYLYNTETGIPLDMHEMHEAYYAIYGIDKPIDWMTRDSEWHTRSKDYSRLPIDLSTTDPRIMLRYEQSGKNLYYDLCSFLRMMPRNNYSTTAVPEPLQQGNFCQWPWDGYVNWYDMLAPPKLQYSVHTDRVCDFWPTLNRVRFEAVPEINGDAVFIRMTTFTPSLETYQIRSDGGTWIDSDEYFTWNLHQGKNRLEMRVKTKFGVYGHSSYIECNFVAKPIAKPVGLGDMNQ